MKRGDKGYWAWRATTGRPKAIPTPEKLLELAFEYFQEVDDTPILKEELLKGGMFAGDKGTTNLQRPYTWAGLESKLYAAGIICRLDEYKRNVTGSYDDFQDALRIIDNEMTDQKFSGAAVGIFNAGIIASDLGLAKKIEQSVSFEQPLFPELENLD